MFTTCWLPTIQTPSWLLTLAVGAKYTYHLRIDSYVKQLKMLDESKLRLNLTQSHVTPHVCFLRSYLRPFQMKTFKLPSCLFGDVFASSHEIVTGFGPLRCAVMAHAFSRGPSLAPRSLSVHAGARDTLYCVCRYHTWSDKNTSQ